MINENIVDFAYLQSLFFLFLCFLFSASSLKTSFFCCFNSYYLLSRTKFGIRAWLLIVLTIKRSICLCLTLDWSKKKRTVLIKKKNCSSALFIINDNDFQQRQTHHREDLHISPTERSTILHQRRSQPTITTKTQVHADLLPSTTRNAAATTGLCLQQPKSVLQTISRNYHWLAPSSSSTSRNATIHSALAFSSDNGSTGPRLAATPHPLPSHRRAQIESWSPVSCAIAISSSNRS